MGSTSGKAGPGLKGRRTTEMFGSSWETRLEEARARRAEALAEKGVPDDPVPVEKPWAGEPLPETPPLIDETRENVSRLKRERPTLPALPTRGTPPAAGRAGPADVKSRKRAGKGPATAAVTYSAAPVAAGAGLAPSVRDGVALPRWGLVAAGALIAFLPVAGYAILVRDGGTGPFPPAEAPFTPDDAVVAGPGGLSGTPAVADAPVPPQTSGPGPAVASPSARLAAGSADMPPRSPEAPLLSPVAVETLDFPVELLMAHTVRLAPPAAPLPEGGAERPETVLSALRAPAGERTFEPGAAPFRAASIPASLAIPGAFSGPGTEAAPEILATEADAGPPVPEHRTRPAGLPPATADAVSPRVAPPGASPVLVAIGAPAPLVADGDGPDMRIAALGSGPVPVAPGARLETPLAGGGAMPLRPSDPPPPSVAPGALVVVHAPETVAADTVAAEAETVAGATGFAIEFADPVPFKISNSNVRYFHPEDRETAAAVAEAISARLRDFTAFRPAPDAGTIEVWLEGAAASGASTTASAAPPAPAPAPVRQKPARVRPAPPKPVFETTTITRTRRSGVAGLLSGQ